MLPAQNSTVTKRVLNSYFPGGSFRQRIVRLVTVTQIKNLAHICNFLQK